MPTFKFSGSVSDMKGIPASRMIPLWVQIQVVLGGDGIFLPAADADGVHSTIAMLLDLGYLLHLQEYTAAEVDQLERSARR